MRGFAARIQLGKFAFIRGRDTAWKIAVAEVHAYIDKHVVRVLNSTKGKCTNASPSNGIANFGRYILLDETAKETQDPVDLRYQLLHVFFPAYEATGIAASIYSFNLVAITDTGIVFGAKPWP